MNPQVDQFVPCYTRKKLRNMFLKIFYVLDDEKEM
jgi:hypothetical protein